MARQKKVVKKALKKRVAKKVIRKNRGKKHPGWGGRRVKGVSVKMAEHSSLPEDEISTDLGNNLKLFRKEKNIPLPPGRVYDEVEEVKEKVIKLGKSLQPYESFVINNKRKHLAIKTLNHSYPERKWRARTIEDNTSFARVWRVK